jgi:hypothetical protein
MTKDNIVVIVAHSRQELDDELEKERAKLQAQNSHAKVELEVLEPDPNQVTFKGSEEAVSFRVRINIKPVV